MAQAGLGDAQLGFAVPGGAAQLRVLPWAVSHFTVRFDRPVQVVAQNLRLLGITDKLELEPAAHPPAEEDVSKPQLPTTLEESLHLLEQDQRISEMLGSEFIKAYTVMRRYELQRFADHVTDWELQEYLEIY